MKKVVISLIVCIFLISLVSSIPIYVKPLDGSGNLQPNTDFNYTFNWSLNNSCSDIILSNTSTITTGGDGIGFIDIDISSLNQTPNYLCEYRNGSLRKVHNFSNTIFNTIFAQNIKLGFGNSTNMALDFQTTNPTGLYYDGTNLVWKREGTTTIGYNADQMTFRGGGDSRIYWGANQYVALQGGDTHLYVNNSGIGINTTNPLAALHVNGISYFDGNVGIGTITPSELLDIEKNQNDSTYVSIVNTNQGEASRAGLDIYTNTGQYLTSRIFSSGYVESGLFRPNSSIIVSRGIGDGHFAIGTSESDSDLQFFTGGLGISNIRMVILDTGKIGIGTTNPSFDLHLQKDADAGDVEALIYNTGTSSTTDARLMLKTDAGAGDPELRWSIGTVDYKNFIDNDDNDKWKWRRQSVDFMTFDTSGDLGVGTTTPSAKFHVKGTTDEQQFIVQANNPQTGNIVEVQDSSGGNYFSIGNTGNIQAGTVSADSRLHVSGTGFQASRLTLERTEATYANTWHFGITGIGAAYKSLHIYPEDTAADIAFFTQGNGTTPSVNDLSMIIKSSGNVGIGTANPSYPLHVAANVSNISIYAEANISAMGYITHTSIFNSNKKAWDYIRNSTNYTNGTVINHSAFYGYVIYNTTDYSNPVYENITDEICNYGEQNITKDKYSCIFYEEETEIQVCDNDCWYDEDANQVCTEVNCRMELMNITGHNCTKTGETYNITEIVQTCHNETTTITTYPYTKEEEGVLIDDEIAMLKQALYDIYAKIEERGIVLNLRT